MTEHTCTQRRGWKQILLCMFLQENGLRRIITMKDDGSKNLRNISVLAQQWIRKPQWVVSTCDFQVWGLRSLKVRGEFLPRVGSLCHSQILPAPPSCPGCPSLTCPKGAPRRHLVITIREPASKFVSLSLSVTHLQSQYLAFTQHLTSLAHCLARILFESNLL